MPSGGSTALNDVDWEVVRATYREAKMQGLEFEWLRWFVGGLVIDKKSVTQAANDAATEWDF